MDKKIGTMAILLLFLAGCSQIDTVDTILSAHNITGLIAENSNHTEVDDKYTRDNVIAYTNANGTKTIYIYSAPIEHSGNFITDTGGEYYIAEGDYMVKSFPKTLSAEKPIQVVSGSNFINISPNGQSVYYPKQETIINSFGQRLEAIVYKGLFGEDIDYRCYPTSFGINSEIILTRRPESNIFYINIETPFLFVNRLSPDYISLRAGSDMGDVKSLIYTPLAVDGANRHSYDNRVSVDVVSDSKFLVRYTIDQKFLNDENTQYPVTINQSVYLYKPKQPDATAYYNGTDSQTHYLSPYMVLGDQTEKGEGWAYVRFETLYDLKLQSDNVLSAKYHVRNLFDTEETDVSIYGVNTEWSSMGLKWNNRPGNDIKPIATTRISKRGDYSFEITGLVKEWLKGGNKVDRHSIQTGLMMKCAKKEANVMLSSCDSGLYCTLLEITIK